MLYIVISARTSVIRVCSLNMGRGGGATEQERGKIGEVLPLQKGGWKRV